MTTYPVSVKSDYVVIDLPGNNTSDRVADSFPMPPGGTTIAALNAALWERGWRVAGEWRAWDMGALTNVVVRRG